MTNAKNVALYVYNDKKGELLAEKLENKMKFLERMT